MRFATAPAALLLALAFASEAGAQQSSGLGQGIGAHARRWAAKMDGDITVDNNGTTGTGMDVHSDLGLTESENLNDIGLTFTFPMLGHVNLQYFWGDYQAVSTPSQNLTYAGTTFAAGTPITTDLGFKVWSLLFEQPMPGPAAFGLGSFTLEGGFKFIRIDTEITDGVQTQSAALNGFFPVLGVHAKVPFSKLIAVEMDLNGIFLSGIAGGGFDGTFWDSAVTLQATVSYFYAGVGYRWFKLNVTDKNGTIDRFDASLNVKGFFLEVGLKF
jgi:hypothetical protein